MTISSLLNHCYDSEDKEYYVHEDKVKSFITKKEWKLLNDELRGCTVGIAVDGKFLIPKTDIIFAITKNSLYWD